MRNILVIGLFLLSSCRTIPSNRLYLKDYYTLTNQLILKAYETRDSVYVFDKFSSKDIETKKFFYLFYYMERSGENEQVFAANFKKFLLKHAIDYDDEIVHFKKQVNKPIRIVIDKIKLKKFKIYPMTKENIDKYMLRSEYSEFNQNFARNMFSYSHPIFTKDGKSAIINSGRAHSNYFLIYKKIKNKWIQVDKYDSNNITIIE